MNEGMEPIGEKNIILFDGVCHLCLGSIRFLLRCDTEAHYRLAWLQSSAARRLLSGVELPAADSVVLLQDGLVYFRSTAILRALAGLGGIWQLARILLLVPVGMRDVLYDFIGARRYRWFGRSARCELPAASVADRFLTDGMQLEKSA
jgi:predicted DCC family thiol-disulfide oxidoreductase YuxK